MIVKPLGTFGKCATWQPTHPTSIAVKEQRILSQKNGLRFAYYIRRFLVEDFWVGGVMEHEEMEKKCRQ